MKRFLFKSKTRMSGVSSVSILSSVSLSKFNHLLLSSKQDRGGYTSFSLKSGVYDRSREHSLHSSVTIGKNESYGLTVRILKLATHSTHKLVSKIRIRDYTELRLTSSLYKSRRASFTIKGIIKKNAPSHYRMKSFVKLGELKNFRFMSSTRYKSKDEVRAFFLTSYAPMSAYFSTASQKVDLGSVSFYPVNINSSDGNFNGTRSVHIHMSIIEKHTIPEYRGKPLPFTKKGLLLLSSVRKLLCAFKTSLSTVIPGSKYPYFHITGQFGKLAGVKSNTMSFSTNRDIIEFQNRDETSVSVPIIMSDIDMNVYGSEITIGKGINLFYVSISKYRSLMDPRPPRVEDSSFSLKRGSEEILVNSKSTVFELKDSSGVAYNTDINEKDIPVLLRNSYMTNISFVRSFVKSIRLNPDSGVKASMAILRSKLAGNNYIEASKCHAREDNRGLGAISNYPVEISLLSDGMFSISKSNLLCFFGTDEYSTVQGDKVTLDEFVLDDNGNVVSTYLKEYTIFSGGRVSVPVKMNSTIRIPLLNGLSCRVALSIMENKGLILIAGFRKSILVSLGEKNTIPRYKGIESNLKILGINTYQGVRSEKEYFSANMLFTLPRIFSNIKLEIN